MTKHLCFLMPWALCALAQKGASPRAPDDQSPTIFHSETRAVQINAAAKNEDGEPLHDLHKDDFTVFDDGKPRGIVFFSSDSGRFAPTMSDPGSEAARKGSARLTAIVLDGINTEFSDQSYARSEAIKAVGRMPIDESVAILALASDLKLQNFTRNRGLLIGAINSFRPNIPPYPMRQRIQITLAALKTLAGTMSGAADRKSIVWITRGFPQIRAYDGAIQRTLNKIDDLNVAIYPIDARGLTMGRGALKNIETMQQFAEATGGVAYYNRNDVAAAVEVAIEDARFTYVLGFYLNDRDRDRRFHMLRVEVDRPNTVLRYRRGYTPVAQ